MHKVLVTGGSGFLGKNLIETLLLKKYLVYQAFYDKKKREITHVRKFNNKETEPLVDFKNLKKIDCIIHCAAKLPDKLKKKNNDLEEYRKSNVKLTLQTAKQAISKGVKRFIFISSALATSSTQRKNSPTKNFYAITKLETENALIELSRQTGLEIVILRPPLIYGKYVKSNFSILLNLIYNRMPLPLKNINNLRSYVGVDNLIDLIIVCISHPKAIGQIFPVSDNSDISIYELVKKISKYMKRSLILFSMPLPLISLMASIFSKKDQLDSITKPLHIDITVTNKRLGWKPIYSLDFGVKKLVAWYLKNR